MGHGGNVIDELVTDHREVEELFGRIEALPPGEKNRKLYAGQANAMADREIEDHAKAEQLMKDLEGCEARDPAFDRLVSELMSDVRAHIADEEQTLFPQLCAACSEKELDELGEKVRRARRTAPTRPHPSAPDTPPANELLALGAGLVDRPRDALSGRGKEG